MTICTAAQRKEYRNIHAIVAMVSVLSVMTQNSFQERQVAVEHMLNRGHPQSTVPYGPRDRRHTAPSTPPHCEAEVETWALRDEEPDAEEGFA